MAGPQHLVVLVNGLWGWQRDWAQMKRALDAQSKDGRLLVHVSAVNVGAQTYAGESRTEQTAARMRQVSKTPCTGNPASCVWTPGFVTQAADTVTAC